VLSASIVVALGVAVSLITSTVVASRAYHNRVAKAAEVAQELTVKGFTRSRVRSDLGTWTIRISGEGEDMAAAYAQLEFAADRVQSFLAAQQFPDDEITLSAIHTDTHYHRDEKGQQTRQVSGYTLQRHFKVTSVHVDRITAAAGEVTQLLKENVRVASSAPDYYYTKVADLKVKILGEASQDALARAREIAANSGCAVGEVRTARMGVIQITQPHSTEVSSSGIYDTSTIEKDISVVVTVTYGISRS